MSRTSLFIGAPEVEPSSSPIWWTNPYVEQGSIDLWTDSKFQDFQIIIGDQVLDVHKCVLAVRSPVFAAMLTSGLTETQTGQMIIKDFDYDIVKTGIQFCYSESECRFENSVTNIWTLLTFGHKYDIQHLIRSCLLHFKDFIDSYDKSEKKFIIKSAFDLGCDQILDPILEIFGVISENLVPDPDYYYYQEVGCALAQEEYFKDLKIICDNGTEFSVHKFILALRSPVFDQILEKMAQNGDTSGRLTIKKIKAAVVQKAIKFMYIGYVANNAFVNNSEDLILGLLEFADGFKIQELVTFCLEKIYKSKKKLDKEVILTYIQTAGKFESKKILQFIQDIFGTQGFKFDSYKAYYDSYWN